MIVPIVCRDPVPGDESISKPVHYIDGCSIEYDGPAKVSTYFTPRPYDEKISTEETDHASRCREVSSSPQKGERGTSGNVAYFRGRMMRGIDVPIPQGYTMYICEKEEISDGDDCLGKCVESPMENNTGPAAALCLTPVNNRITIWKHHICPDIETDSFIKSLDWPSMASALHES